MSVTKNLRDSNGTAAGGEFFVNGVAQTGSHKIDVTNVASALFDARTAGGSDVLWEQLQLNDGSPDPAGKSSPSTCRLTRCKLR
jgi:hypothetical protein